MARYKDLCVEWNNIIPFKIKESDIAIPSETLLTNALLHYLEQFGISIGLLQECHQSENIEIRHKFKVDLCTYINHLYKLGNETSQPFSYLDLINPTPKKTHHILKYLLNYLLFFNKMKLDVIEPTKEKIVEFNKIEIKKKADKMKLEKAKIREKNYEEQIEKYYHEMPILNDTLESLITKDKDQTKIKNQLKFSIEDIDVRFTNLKSQKLNLRLKVVTDDEANTIISKKKTIEEKLEEQCEIEYATLEGNRGRKISINKFEELIKHGENVLETYSLEKCNKLVLLQKQRAELNKSSKQLTSKNFQRNELIQQNIKQIKNLKNCLIEKSFNLENIKKQNEKIINEMKKKIENEEQNNEAIDFKLHDIEDSLMEEEENENTIQNAKDILLKDLQERDPFLLDLANKMKR